MNPLREGLLRQRVPEPCALVIFGASGDLCHRKLMPAIYSLAHEGLLPPYFSIIGVAVTDHTIESFRESMKQAVMQFSRYKPINQAVMNALADGMSYVNGDFNDPATYQRLKELLATSERERGTRHNRLFISPPRPVFSRRSLLN